jgi:FkbM family methyltransferase
MIGAAMQLRTLFGDAPRPLAALKDRIPIGVRDEVVYALICADAESRRNLRRAFRREGDDVVGVRLRALGGERLWIRPRADDPWILRETLTYADCMPPADAPDPRLILDVGANIGASMARFAATFPQARVVGLEPDPANAELCRRNLAPWADRCTLIEAAAWTHDGTVRLSGTDAAWMKVGDSGREVRALSLASVLAEVAADTVDFLKLDIEGAERHVLTQDTGWSAAVACVNVEVHAPYTTGRCVADLEALGFTVAIAPAPRGGRVIGRRPRSAR